MWFEKLTGFKEESAQQVRANMFVDGHSLISKVNGGSFTFGSLETPSLADLRYRVRDSDLSSGILTVREIVGDVKRMHVDQSNAGALFQVASQFNLLEMVSPNVTPEHGVSGYETDQTQGPACAVAAGAGTIYRNYFAEVNGAIGRSSGNQIDCLAEMGSALDNSSNRLWEMKNGYALASEQGLIEITDKLKACSEAEFDEFRQSLRIGIQWDTEVTISDTRHTVSQIYCSALPVAYSQYPTELWTAFAKVVLEASYEATICAAVINTLKTGNNKVYLTLIGGHAFGNQVSWIMNAIRRSLDLYRNFNLDIVIVSYNRSKPHVQELINGF